MIRRPRCVTAATTLLLAVILGGCATSPPASLDDSLDLIGKRALKSHVRWLADDDREGRMIGEAGYDLAAEYVVEQFEKMGLEAGGRDGWYQRVTLRTYKSIEDTAQLLIHHGATDHTLDYRDDFAVGGNSVARAFSVRADVVYVGYGVHAPDLGYSDYTNVDVRGKIVAWYRGAPESFEGEHRLFHSSSARKRKDAVARGAVGVITLRSRKEEKSSSWDSSKKRIGKRGRTTWVGDDGEPANHLPQLLGSASLSPAAARILFEGSSISYEDSLDAMESGIVASTELVAAATIAGESEHRDFFSPNVVGRVRGTDPALADEYVVYTAHLDHLGTREEDESRIVFNGAYDNAMGVALMLETARAVAAFPPKRSVLFLAVTAEEKGLLGSDFFVNNPAVPRKSIVANINLDMPLFLYPVADLVAFGSENSTLQRVAEGAAEAEGFYLSPDPIPEEKLFVRSDQYSFVRKGIPAIYLVPGFTSLNGDVDGEALFRDFLKNHYHKASDNLRQPIDWSSAVRFARAHTRIGYAVASQADRPSWLEGNVFGERFATP